MLSSSCLPRLTVPSLPELVISCSLLLDWSTQCHHFIMPSTGGMVNIFPMSNYNFSLESKDSIYFSSLPVSLQRLKVQCDLIGTPKQTVEAVILVHEHNLPHVLLLQVSPALFLLPGGEVDIDENELDALRRYLDQYLSPHDSENINWEIVDMVANWWRPNFENVKYPYIPAHITKPKEHTRLYLVRLPEKASFSVPKNLKLVAVPLLELYDNTRSYGPVISSLPQTLSRFNFNLL